jgi:hypothetical protein
MVVAALRRRYRIPRLAVFAVFAANYQPSTSRCPQKSWSFEDWSIEGTARYLAVLSLFFAVLSKKTATLAKAVLSRRTVPARLFSLGSAYPK